MKSIEELKKLREQLKAGTAVRKDAGTKIIVGMGTCGIAAGAREAMNAVLDEIAKRHLQDVQISQTGCIGMCALEPLMDVVRPGEPRVTYGHVTPELARRIVTEHVINGNIVEDAVIGKIE